MGLIYESLLTGLLVVNFWYTYMLTNRFRQLKESTRYSLDILEDNIQAASGAVFHWHITPVPDTPDYIVGEISVDDWFNATYEKGVNHVSKR